MTFDDDWDAAAAEEEIDAVAGKVALDVDRAQVASACRHAVHTFLAVENLGKTELAGWLSGPYRTAVQFCIDAFQVAGLAPVSSVRQRASSLPYTSDAVRDERLRAVVQAAREELVALLVSARDGTLDLAALRDALIDSGALQPCLADDGAPLHLPVDNERMRLSERLLAVAVAYFLADGREP